MWYYSWVLGLGLAATVGILNAMWYELRLVREQDEGGAPPMRTP
jgi:cyd operon protein YbgT